MGSVALEGFGGGGGAALNFKVVPNPQPSVAKENTIWVDTDRINNYYFSAEQPENMVDYDVWFPVGTSSAVEFNALKKGCIQVYPLSAKQMVSGVLKDVTAKSYQGGKWVGWIPPNRLFKSGFGALVEFTLGKEANAVTPTITKDAFTFTENSSGSSNYAYAITEEPINVTNISKIYVQAKATNSSKIWRMGTSESNSAPYSQPSDGYTDMNTANVEKVYEFNVSHIPGLRYFKIIGNNGGTITDIWYE